MLYEVKNRAKASSLSYRKVVKKMNEQEVLVFMLDSIKKDNYEMAAKSGMTDDQIKDFFDQSEPSLTYMIKNLYDRMKQQGIIS